MTDPKFVKGPLHAGSTEPRVAGDEDYHAASVADEEGLVVGEGHGATEDEAIANAELFAAAPDLYAALEVAMLAIDGLTRGDVLSAETAYKLGSEIGLALKKARGES